MPNRNFRGERSGHETIREKQWNWNTISKCGVSKFSLPESNQRNLRRMNPLSKKLGPDTNPASGKISKRPTLVVRTWSSGISALHAGLFAWSELWKSVERCLITSKKMAWKKHLRGLYLRSRILSRGAWLVWHEFMYEGELSYSLLNCPLARIIPAAALQILWYPILILLRLFRRITKTNRSGNHAGAWVSYDHAKGNNQIPIGEKVSN